jgi:hypothetical protein
VQQSVFKNPKIVTTIVGVFLAVLILSIFIFFNYYQEKPQNKIHGNVTFMSFDELRENQLKEIKIENQHVSDIISSCGIDEHCTADAFRKLAKTEDQTTILKAIDDYLTVFQNSEYNCHHMAHHVGEFLLGYSNGNLTKALNLASQKCGGALYHGVVENYLVSGVLLDKINLNNLEITNLCDSLNDNPKSQIRLECSHGFGHGLYKVYSYDINKSTNHCDDFKTTLERNLCYKGVFMEVQIQYAEHREEGFDKTDIFFPCDKLDNEKTRACYFYQAYYILSQNQFSLEKGLEQCNNILPTQFIKDCYSGIGAQGISKSGDPSEFISSCQTGQQEYQIFCVLGGTNYLVDQIGIEKAIEFCDTVPERFASECYKTVGVYIHRIYDSSEQVSNECSKIKKSEYVEDCVNVEV